MKDYFIIIYEKRTTEKSPVVLGIEHYYNTTDVFKRIDTLLSNGDLFVLHEAVPVLDRS